MGSSTGALGANTARQGNNVPLGHPNNGSGAVPVPRNVPQHHKLPVPTAPSATPSPSGLRQPPAPMRIPGPATHHKLVAHSPRATTTPPMPVAGMPPLLAVKSDGSEGNFPPQHPPVAPSGLYSPPYSHRQGAFPPPAPMPPAIGGMSPVSQIPAPPAAVAGVHPSPMAHMNSPHGMPVHRHNTPHAHIAHHGANPGPGVPGQQFSPRVAVQHQVPSPSPHGFRPPQARRQPHSQPRVAAVAPHGNFTQAQLPR